MTKKTYARELTKDYLINNLGIFYVAWDGTEIKKINRKTHEIISMPYVLNQGYYKVQVYDPEYRQSVPKEERDTHTGEYFIAVARICYCWYRGDIQAGMVVDHIDNNKLNNDPWNLQLLTPSQNICKGTNKNTKLIKCNLNKPLSFYEDKLAEYIRIYEEAKLNKDANEAHKQRANIANIRGKIRYYKKMKEEVSK